MMPISRPWGRRRPGLVVIAASVGSAAILTLLATPGSAWPQAPKTIGATPPPELARQVGTSSCAARGCHGAVGPVDAPRGEVFIKNGAFTTWRHFDPHARAFEVLGEPRSKRIADRLKGSLGGKPADRSATCLACHATASPASATGSGPSVLDGVACESCHGPARDWLEPHTSPGWRRDGVARARDGLADLFEASGRAKACVDCHVGNKPRGMDVNHDLIAAGHPRLNFEFSGYLASYPRHWREKASPAAGARDWAVGQAVTASAALKLLGDRAIAARDAKPGTPPWVAPWPEFSESECFACHHQLEEPSWNPDRGDLAARPGRPAWSTWNLAMLPDLAKVALGWDHRASEPPWSDLRAEMSRGEPDPAVVARLAAQAGAGVDAWLAAPRGAIPGAEQVASILEGWSGGSRDRKDTWDQAAQRYLAISALARAGKRMGIAPAHLDEAGRVLEAYRMRLGFAPGFDSPRGGRPLDPNP